MSYRSQSHQSTHQVRIDPYCIFCGKPTSNVEQHTTSKTKTTVMPGSGVRYEGASLTIPFPAHPECLKKEKRDTWLWSIVGAVAIAVILLIVGAIVANTSESAATTICTLGFFAAIGGGIGINWWLGKALENRIVEYYKTHLQR
ncbi:MAG: hypothetical protein JXB47_10705 [Anaerolineae bacterium]|nr:hypothetical protein [Anaerolineae bacterium]